MFLLFVRKSAVDMRTGFGLWLRLISVNLRTGGWGWESKDSRRCCSSACWWWWLWRQFPCGVSGRPNCVDSWRRCAWKGAGSGVEGACGSSRWLKFICGVLLLGWLYCGGFNHAKDGNWVNWWCDAGSLTVYHTAPARAPSVYTLDVVSHGGKSPERMSE